MCRSLERMYLGATLALVHALKRYRKIAQTGHASRQTRHSVKKKELIPSDNTHALCGDLLQWVLYKPSVFSCDERTLMTSELARIWRSRFSTRKGNFDSNLTAALEA